MGILDEAIREHLELKRQQGADEKELKGLEDQAFGQAERPGATGPAAAPEAETRIISPGSSVTSPAGEGDQLDKVFAETRQAEADAAAAKARAEASGAEAAVEPRPAAEAQTDPEATFAEHPVPEPPAAPEETAAAAGTSEQPTVDSPEAKREIEPEPVPEEPAGEGDAGDLLEAERHHLSSHPTEHYDVDAAIAEEEEIDVLSESSLSDELDRALESGEEAAAEGETVEYDMSSEPDSGEIELDEPEPAEQEAADSTEAVEEDEADSAELLYEDAATENQPVEEAETESEGDFFDQDDVLEATPDFLEETPEHDRLWFEQKEPKDFDFGD